VYSTIIFNTKEVARLFEKLFKRSLENLIGVLLLRKPLSFSLVRDEVKRRLVILSNFSPNYNRLIAGVERKLNTIESSSFTPLS
jgi:hypothetical protein